MSLVENFHEKCSREYWRETEERFLIEKFRLFSAEDPTIEKDSSWILAKAKHLELTMFKDGKFHFRLIFRTDKFCGSLWSNFYLPDLDVDLKGVKSCVQERLDESRLALSHFNEDFPINIFNLERHINNVPVAQNLIMCRSFDLPVLSIAETYETLARPRHSVLGQSFLSLFTEMIVDLNFHGAFALDSLMEF